MKPVPPCSWPVPAQTYRNRAGRGAPPEAARSASPAINPAPRRTRTPAALAIGLRGHPQVRLPGDESLRKLLHRVGVGDGGDDDHVLALLAVHRGRHLITRSELQ